MTSRTLAEAIRWTVESRVREIHTAIPGRVESYDPATQTADVQPMVKRVWVDPNGVEVVERYPLIPAVPVVLERADNAFLSMPVKVGCFVWLQFGERAIDMWREKGSETDPGDLRIHSTADAVAFPGVYPGSKALGSVHPDNIVLGFDDGVQVHLTPDGVINLGEESAADFVALASLVKNEITALRTTVNTLVTAYNGHVHVTTATVGAGTTPGELSPPAAQATAPDAVGDVAAETVKAT